MAKFALRNELGRYIVAIAWMGINIYLFVSAYISLQTSPKNFYLRVIVKEGLAFARASAAVLNFNCMLILLTMCRNLLSSIRGLGVRDLLYSNCLINEPTCFKELLFVLLPSVILTSGFSDQVPVVELWKLAAGITGAVITLCLILMLSSATELIRRSYFEVFWYNHHLFVIFYIGLVVHGVQGIVRFQSNTDEHDPETCSKNVTSWGKEGDCKTLPKFAPFGMNTWKWVVGPMFLYLVERGIRFYRSFQTVKIMKVVNHPSKVIEIQMKKAGFHHAAGQYIFLKCPKLSHLEWHPFTLTSAPEDDFFSVHIRIAGDWTGGLAKLCGGDGKQTRSLSDMPRLAVDGPFGTATTDVFKYPVVMCIGAGIGVTPFASILKSIWYQYNQNNVNPVVKKVYFFWICPDTNAFEWFTDLLQYLEERMVETGNRDFLEYNIYLTRGWGPNMARTIVLHEDEETDIITGCKQKTRYGRPEWNGIFGSVARAHPRTNIGVFFCGPAVLSHQLHQTANAHSNVVEGTKFYYNKENF
ncbi:cytochrome b-245 heavy chain-like [Pocillopora damicornis]|uniref:cytochrome b-245 heavy chain-like n=1 Tax=Pocillopora damicornis TaxID=46731 RepID=UPI000F55188C|nr:cytochrome b-245 heavy chain-like [Pocillopora damicornis]